MAGFMTAFGGSPLGAFVGGAAQQGSANIEAAQKAEQGMDTLWAAKFAQGEQAYQKERSENQKNTFIYNQVLASVNGNKQLADLTMGQILLNPHGASDLISQASRMAASGKYSNNPTSQSDYLGSLEQGLSGRRQYLEGIKAGASPSAQRHMTIPESNYGGQSNADYGSPQSQPIGISPLANPNTAPQGQPSSPPSGNHPTSPPDKPAGTGFEPYTFSPENKNPVLNPEDPQTWKFYDSQDALKDALKRKGKDPLIADHAMTADKLQQQEIEKQKQLGQQKTDQWMLEHPNYNRTKLQDVYSTSLNKQVDALQNTSELATDASNAITMIRQGGLKTNATQPIFDVFNKVLASMGNDELQKLGLANKVSDYNMLQKVITRLQFGQIPNYHLGRWTEREVGMLNKMILSGSTDENTNIKIALLIKNNSERTMRQVSDQAEAAGTGSPSEMSKALQIRNSHNKELSDPKGRLPWIDVDPSGKPDEFHQQWAQAAPGTAFNNVVTGQIAFKPEQ